MTTMIISVEFDTTFSFTLTYTDPAGTEWTATVQDGETIQFVNTSQYTLSDGEGTQTFTFDGVQVGLGPSLDGMDALECDLKTRFDFGSITFPDLGTQSSVVESYAWCQAVVNPADPTEHRLVDPKLGLSNTTGNSGVSVPSWPACGCSRSG